MDGRLPNAYAIQEPYPWARQTRALAGMKAKHERGRNDHTETNPAFARCWIAFFKLK